MTCIHLGGMPGCCWGLNNYKGIAIVTTINLKLYFEQQYLGRCEKLISPPIIMNNILKVAYGHKKNNKTIHLTLGGLGVTALSDLLEGKNTKDFQNL